MGRTGHHAALHLGLFSMTGRAPYNLAVVWKYGPPLPLGIDAATRSDLLVARLDAIAAVPPSERERDVPRGTYPSRMSTFSSLKSPPARSRQQTAGKPADGGPIERAMTWRARSATRRVTPMPAGMNMVGGDSPGGGASTGGGSPGGPGDLAIVPVDGT